MYLVKWRVDALDVLADFYVALDPTVRAVLTSSVQALNTALHNNPGAVGRPRRSGFRAAVIPHLVVWFQVDDLKKIVHVVRIRAIQP